MSRLYTKKTTKLVSYLNQRRHLGTLPETSIFPLPTTLPESTLDALVRLEQTSAARPSAASSPITDVSLPSTKHFLTSLHHTPTVPDAALQTRLPTTALVKPRDIIPPFNRPFPTAEEERHVLSILRLINLYDENTTENTKVEHLKALSRTSFTILDFKRDRRFLTLLNMIHMTIVPYASPRQRQIIAASYQRLNIVHLKFWRKLLIHSLRDVRRSRLKTLIQRCSHHLMAPNLCFMLHKLSQTRVRPYAELLRCFTILCKMSTELFPADIDRLTSAARRLHLHPQQSLNDGSQEATPVMNRALSVLAHRTAPYVNKMSPSLLIRILHNFSRLRAIPVFLLVRAEPRLQRQLSTCTPIDIAVLLKTYRASLLTPPQLLLRTVENALSPRLTSLPPSVLCSLFVSFETMPSISSRFLGRMASCVAAIQ